MSIDEYMQGWLSGTGAAECENHYPQPQDDYERGYAAGRAAYLAAEQTERVLLERCECSYLHRVGTSQRTNYVWQPKRSCKLCHGTMKRVDGTGRRA